MTDDLLTEKNLNKLISKSIEQVDNPVNSVNSINPVDRSIYDIINQAKYNAEIENYITNPIIGKESCWDPLGDKLSTNEKNCPSIINPQKYFTVRLDGKNFSKTIPKLKKMNLFENGYSHIFENIMKKIIKEIAIKFQKVLYVYTQSDEITVLVDHIDSTLSNNENNIEVLNELHEFSGRRDKLISLMSSFVTNIFVKEITKLCIGSISQQNSVELIKLIDDLPQIQFDARIGVYDTLQEAFELIIWRSYDCQKNGVSQALYLNGYKKHDNLNTMEKLKILTDLNLLPMTNHQAYGTLIKRTYKKEEMVNLKTLKTHITERRYYEIIEGPIVKNLKQNVFDDIIYY